MEEGPRTSGNVPLEKTLSRSWSVIRSNGLQKEDRYSHQQTCLSAGTITNDNKLATDLSHGGCWCIGQIRNLGNNNNHGQVKETLDFARLGMGEVDDRARRWMERREGVKRLRDDGQEKGLFGAIKCGFS